MATHKVGYIVGSLATGSINRKLAKALVRLAPASLEITEIPIRDLPLYSYDYDKDYPAPAQTFKRAIEASDAILFVTPEYNRWIPGALKNAIDWGSRPKGSNSFARKPSAVIGTSAGKIGTAVAQRELQSVLGVSALAADGSAGGLHPVHAGPDRRRGQGRRRKTEAISDEVPRRVQRSTSTSQCRAMKPHPS